MKKTFISLSLLTFFSFNLMSQSGYDIKINFKGCTDSSVYLAKYFFDRVPIVDSVKNLRNGKIQFKGENALDKGVYILANQTKTSFYFQFIVDDNQKFTINLDAAEITKSLKSPDDKQNDQFFSYVRYMSEKNQEMSAAIASVKGKSIKDSTRIVSEKQKALNAEVTKFDSDFMTRNEGTFVHALLNLKNEKYAQEIPNASNGRPDSTYSFVYYKTHYWDGVDFKDDRILQTPFFADKIKKYFEQLVVQHPDSMIKELDKVLMKCVPASQMFNTLVGHFTYKFETNKAMSFDQFGNSNTFEKVFIHLADKYIVNGKTGGYYSAETIVAIKDRIDVLRNLLPGSKVPDLYMIDTVYGKQVLKMGFDTASTNYGATYLYNKNYEKLAPMYKTLHAVKAKYTILVFWAADCGHCQTEVPKLHEDLKAIKNKIDFKVYAVQTKEELFDTWKKFLVEKKLTDFTHVFDPIHLNNLKQQFDIIGTPVIYLLDKDKKIKAKKLEANQVVEILNKLEEIDKKSNKQ
jgi:thiol-disulfide isomerase/thioredoxin